MTLVQRLCPFVSRLLSGRVARALLGLTLLAFCAAPVPGDVGGCNQRGEPLDATAFFWNKQRIDCARCTDCRLETTACVAACQGVTPQSEFPADCDPLVHDGEVCLHALDVASCADYSAFVREAAPTVPTECDFCPGVSK
jgi:hypothetical protein